MPNGIPPWHTPAPYTGMFDPEDFERQREITFNYMAENQKLRKESRDKKAQIYQQNWDAYNEYFQEMSKLRQELADLEYNESEKHAAASMKGDYYATPLPVQQKIGQVRTKIQALDYNNFQAEPATRETPITGAAAEPTAVGTYNPALDSASPFGYRAPAAAAQPFGTEGAAAIPVPLAPTPAAVPPTIDMGLGGVVEGAYAGDVVGGQTPVQGGTTYNPAIEATSGYGQPIDAYEGMPGVPTPGFRGFGSYNELRRGMEDAGRGRDQYGRVETGMLQPWDFQDMNNGELSAADSLQQYLGRDYQDDRVGKSFRGGMIQRVDLGQGIQDYVVRRDAYGNIRSYMPKRASQLHPSQRLFRR